MRNESIANTTAGNSIPAIPPVVATSFSADYVPAAMERTRKKPLSAAELAVAKRLNELWIERKEKLGLTQESVAAELKISQGGVSHYLKGRNAIGFEAMFRWAQILRVHPYEIDPKFGKSLPPDLRVAVDSMIVSGSPAVRAAYADYQVAALRLQESLMEAGESLPHPHR